jgi:chromosome partitioning protein
MNGIIISVANNKGGVGKTTVTCNLGYALTRHSKRILIIDMDSQCNATSLLLHKNANPNHTLYELLNPQTENLPVDRYIYPTEYESLYCLPNISETAGLEPELIKESPISFFRLRENIRNYALHNYDFTIIDTPPNMGTFVITSLYASDFVIVPNEIDSAFSLEGLIKAMNLIKDIKINGNPDLRFLRLLINKVDRRTTISRVAIQHIKKSFAENQFFQTTIPINTAFKQAEHLRQIIFRYKSSAPGAKAYRKLAQELLTILS